MDKRGSMTIREIITGVIMGLVVAIVVMGGMFLWYVIEDTSFCQKYGEANPTIDFEWSFSDGCIFQLPDGTWIDLREYKDQNQYKLEIEK